jgi:hypothetical protein
VPKVLYDKRGEMFWCAFGAGAARMKAQVAPVMEGFYHCTRLNFTPFAGGDEAGIDAVAEVRQALGQSSRGSES